MRDAVIVEGQHSSPAVCSGKNHYETSYDIKYGRGS